MRITFTMESRALLRPRYIRVRECQKARLGQASIYDPSRDFLRLYSAQGYPFNLISLLHAASVKLFTPSYTTRQLLRRTLFASGGLYLALDIRHQDLAVRSTFGDFTAGFSHQFGVALTLMSMSDAFDISWDQLNPIRRTKVPTMDFEALLPQGKGKLQLEAKGTTSSASTSHARGGITRKKSPGGSTNQGTAGMPVAAIGIIVQAACVETSSAYSRGRMAQRSQNAILEIIDPEPARNQHTLDERGIKAGQYWHYAGVALFAGFPKLAVEFATRARDLARGRSIAHRLHDLDFGRDTVLSLPHGEVVGVQWRPSDLAELDDDVWFYQAADPEILRQIAAHDDFPSVKPYHFDSQQPRPVVGGTEIASSILPDQSFFGIGVGPLGRLRKTDPREEQNGDARQMPLW